jgi:hypothetical protein
MTNARDRYGYAGAVDNIESLPGQRDDTTAVRADSTRASLSVLTASEPRIVSKRFSLRDSVLIKTTAAAVARGRIERIEVGSLAVFADVLQGLTTAQALVYGVHLEHNIELVTERAWHDHGCPPDETPRTKKNFAFPCGPGVMMHDYDPAPDGEPLSREELVAHTRQAVPGLADARMLWMPSTGSCIHNEETGEELVGLRGQRLYILVADATDIPRAGAALCDRLWLIGRGRIDISAAGSLLERTDVDGSVWSPERIDFPAGADCRPPLVQRRGEPKIIDGTIEFVDTRTAFPALTDSERKRVDDLKALARAAAQPMAEVVKSARRDAYVAHRAAQAAEAGVDNEQARKCAAAEFNRVHELRELPPDWVLSVYSRGAASKCHRARGARPPGRVRSRDVSRPDRTRIRRQPRRRDSLPDWAESAAAFASARRPDLLAGGGAPALSLEHSR